MNENFDIEEQKYIDNCDPMKSNELIRSIKMLTLFPMVEINTEDNKRVTLEHHQEYEKGQETSNATLNRNICQQINMTSELYKYEVTDNPSTVIYKKNQHVLAPYEKSKTPIKEAIMEEYEETKTPTKEARNDENELQITEEEGRIITLTNNIADDKRLETNDFSSTCIMEAYNPNPIKVVPRNEHVNYFIGQIKQSSAVQPTNLNQIEIKLPPDAIISVASSASTTGKLEVMLDSGAQSSVAAAAPLKLKKYYGIPRSMTGFCGARQKSKGKATIDININNREFTWPVQVFETLGATRADVILGRDFLKDRVIMDWIHGKVTFLMTKKESTDPNNEELIYTFCNPDDADQLINSNHNSLAARVTNQNFVEIIKSSFTNLPTHNIRGLEFKQPLKSSLHAVISINNFMQLIANNVGKRENFLKMIGDTYLETRNIILNNPPTSVWGTKYEHKHPLSRIILELDRHAPRKTTDDDNTCVIKEIEDLKSGITRHFKDTKLRRSFQCMVNKSNFYEKLKGSSLDSDKTQKARRAYDKACEKYVTTKEWLADNNAQFWRRKMFQISALRTTTCGRCSDTTRERINSEWCNVLQTNDTEQLEDAIESFIDYPKIANYKCNKCGNFKSDYTTTELIKAPDILCVRVNYNTITDTPVMMVPRTIELDDLHPTIYEYKLAAAITQVDFTGGNHCNAVIFENDKKCIITRNHEPSIYYADPLREKIPNCKVIFYEKTKKNPICSKLITGQTTKEIEELTEDVGWNNSCNPINEDEIRELSEESSGIYQLLYNIKNDEENPTIRELLHFEEQTDDKVKETVLNLCEKYSDVFLIPGEKLTHTNVASFRLPMKDGSGPINIKQFRVDAQHKEMMTEMIKSLEFHGVIERSFSPYNFPVFLRPKPELDKNGKRKMRMCVDFSKLNQQCIPYFYPLPLIDEVQEQLSQHPFICTLDMSQGYHQVLVAEEDREKLAFTFNGTHWQFVRAPFGLSTISGFFQAMMNNILHDLVGVTCLVYVDDIIIMAQSHEQMLERITGVFDRLREYNFKLNPEKCRFAREELKVLGLLCSKDGIRMDPSRIEKVKNYPEPTNKKKLQEWHGLSNHYKKFIYNYSDIIEPHLQLLRKKVAYVWDVRCQNSFDKIKDSLTTEPVMLFHPDTRKPFEISADASSYALGAVLEQQEKVISYASRTLTPTERRYPVSDLEQLAVVFAVENWRHFLSAQPFKVYTDHKPLAGELRKRSQSSRLMRYKLRLSEFNFEVIYRKGKNNGNADAMSRLGDEVLDETDELIMIIIESEVMTVTTRSKTKAMNAEAEMNNETPEHQTAPPTMASRTEPDTELPDDPRDIATQNQPKLLIHPEDQLETLKVLHDSSFGGHFGCNKTYERIKREFYWKGMKKDIHDYVLKCPKCQVNKKSRQIKMPLQMTQMSQAPFEKIYIDIVEGLPESKNGNNVILSMIDDLTRFVEFAPLPDQRASTIAKALFEDILCRYTFPKEIVSDQGSNFMSRVIQDMCNLLKIKKCRTSAYHPQSNVVERSHSWLGNYLRSIVDQNPTDWDEYLRLAAHANNNTIHTGTKQIPMEALYGFTTKIPIRLKRDPEPVYNPECVPSVFRRKSQVVQKALRSCHPFFKAKTKMYHDRNLNEYQFHVGDLVLMASPPRSSKLTPKYTGPYKITKKISDLLVEIKKPHRKKGENVHVNRLKKFIGPAPVPVETTVTTNQEKEKRTVLKSYVIRDHALGNLSVTYYTKKRMKQPRKRKKR